MTIGYYKNYLYTHRYKLNSEKKKHIYKNKESQYMVSHPETGSDSPIGSDRESGRDISPYAMFGYQKPFFFGVKFPFISL